MNMKLFSSKPHKEINHISVNDTSYTVSIYYEKRRNSRASITKTGINIRIPIFLSKKEKSEQVNKFISWAENTIKEKKVSFRPENKIFKNGDELILYDNVLKIIISEIDTNSISGKIDTENIKISIPKNLNQEDKEKYISKMIARLLAKNYLGKIYEKLYKFNEIHRFGIINNIRLKNNSTNWGSCSSKNNINISIRLLLAPEKVLDYVLMHELSHLKQRNHSAKFWAVVEAACPSYRESELWLKKNGALCVV